MYRAFRATTRRAAAHTSDVPSGYPLPTFYEFTVSRLTPKSAEKFKKFVKDRGLYAQLNVGVADVSDETKEIMKTTDELGLRYNDTALHGYKPRAPRQEGYRVIWETVTDTITISQNSRLFAELSGPLEHQAAVEHAREGLINSSIEAKEERQVDAASGKIEGLRKFAEKSMPGLEVKTKLESDGKTEVVDMEETLRMSTTLDDKQKEVVRNFFTNDRRTLKATRYKSRAIRHWDAQIARLRNSDPRC